jgi:hypothetical protein
MTEWIAPSIRRRVLIEAGVVSPTPHDRFLARRLSRGAHGRVEIVLAAARQEVARRMMKDGEAPSRARTEALLKEIVTSPASSAARSEEAPR